MNRFSEPGISPPQADAADYITCDWLQYAAKATLQNHWDRPGWANGRRSYHWLLTFDDAVELRALAARCQAALGDIPTLDLVPLANLHITLQRAAFTDEISTQTALTIAEAVSASFVATQPFEVQVGPLAGSSGAVRFSAGPHQFLSDIREAIRRAIADVRGENALPEIGKTFVPHVSIAYSNAATPAAPVIERVAALRSLGMVTVTIDTVDLVELRRVGRSYAWDNVARIRLGG